MESIHSKTESAAMDQWSEALRLELEVSLLNGRVGHELLSETDRVRVWRIELAPGERIGFHRHQLDYFWTAMTGGRSRSHHATGEVRNTEYYPGKTRHFRFPSGEYSVHDLENTGDSILKFVTVEFKDSANPPLSLETLPQ